MRITYQILNPTTGRVFAEGSQEVEAEKTAISRADILTDAGVLIAVSFDPPAVQRPAGVKRLLTALAEILFKATMQTMEEGSDIHTHTYPDPDSGDTRRDSER